MRFAPRRAPPPRRLLAAALVGACLGCADGPRPGAAIAPSPGAAVAPQTAPATQATTAPSGVLPSGREVFERYLAATGGRAANEALRSLHQEVAIEATVLLMPAKAQVAIYKKYPSKLRLDVSAHLLGRPLEFLYVTDGTTAWERAGGNPPRVLEGQQRENLNRQADMRLVLDPAANYRRLDCVGREACHGVECYRVEAETHKGEVEVRHYAVDTGLLLQIALRDRRGLGNSSTIHVEEYSPAGGVLFPTRLRAAGRVWRFAWTTTKIDANLPLDDALFKLPAATSQP